MYHRFSDKFYHSKAWIDCRTGYIVSVYGLCERCNDPGYIVHHKITLTPSNIDNPDITLNWIHLEYLCLKCHNKETFGCNQDVIRDGLMFNELGEVIQIE